jgi:hypothetical protein
MSDDGFRYRDLTGQHVDWSDWDDVHRPRLRVVQPGEVAPESEPEPIEAPDAAMRASEPILPPSPDRDGYYVGGQWVDRPAVDPVKGLRAFALALRQLLNREENQP